MHFQRTIQESLGHLVMDEDGLENEESQKHEASLEPSSVQEVIGLLLAPEQHQDEQGLESVEGLTDVKVKSENLAVSSDAGSPGISVSVEDNSLSISRVALTSTGIPLVGHADDLGQQSLEAQAIQLEDGTTAFVHAVPAGDESDSSDAPTKFIDGQAVQLEDGTTAFIHSTPREGLHAIQLQDGTTAYISSTPDSLFDGEAASLGLEHLTSAQIGGDSSQDDKDAMGIKVTLGVVTGTHQVSSARALALGDKAFRCPYEGCGRLYTTQHHLKVHERSHTGDRPFRCTAEGCGKAFATGYGLKSHVRVHTGETPYKCPEEVCNKAFKTSGDLQKHVRTHTGERPFKCPFEGCDRAFTTSNIRKVHIRTHTGERPYVCKEEGCFRAFASATNYKNHIRIHTGEKPYVCTVQGCGKRFTEYSSLYKHHVVHTHSKPYICSSCGKNYRQTSTLAMHKRTTHGIIDGGEDGLEPSVIVSEDGSLGIEDEGDDGDLPDTRPRLQFHLGTDLENGAANLIIHGATQKVAMMTTGATLTGDATIVALHTAQQAAEQAIQQVHDNQEGGTILHQPQQILVVTDPAQLVALQQFAQQAQLGQALSARITAEDTSPGSIGATQIEDADVLGISIDDAVNGTPSSSELGDPSPVAITTSVVEGNALITYTCQESAV